jgi:hypothetical protein
MTPIYLPGHLSQRKNSPCRYGNAAASQADAEPQLAHQIHLLIDAACAARAGAAQMTLDDWRQVELEVKRRLQNEHPCFPETAAGTQRQIQHHPVRRDKL